MKPLMMPKGTNVFLGRPAKPMPQELSSAIGKMVQAIDGIREAFLPQCYAEGAVDPPAQILVLVLDNPADQKTLDAVGQGLTRILPQGMHLDVWPLDGSHSLLSTIRGTRMHVHTDPPPQNKSWWKIFG
jgi:hypothetical protein